VNIEANQAELPVPHGCVYRERSHEKPFAPHRINERKKKCVPNISRSGLSGLEVLSFNFSGYSLSGKRTGSSDLKNAADSVI
jgi:hypothetical protein